MVDFLSVLQSSLNFTVRRYSPDDGEWGLLKEPAANANATGGAGEGPYMSGLVGELNRGLADLCTAGLYVSRERQVRCARPACYHST